MASAESIGNSSNIEIKPRIWQYEGSISVWRIIKSAEKAIINSNIEGNESVMALAKK